MIGCFAAVAMFAVAPVSADEELFVSVATSPPPGLPFGPEDEGHFGIGWHPESHHDASLLAEAQCRQQGGESCTSPATGQSLRGGCVGLAVARWRDVDQVSWQRAHLATSSSFRELISRDLEAACRQIAYSGKYRDDVAEHSCEVVRTICAEDVRDGRPSDTADSRPARPAHDQSREPLAKADASDEHPGTLEPRCANAVADEGCWMPLDNLADCHVWRETDAWVAGAEHVEAASFDGEARCEGGRITGDGKTAWRMPTMDWSLVTWGGAYVRGRLHGDVEVEGHGEIGFHVTGRIAEGAWDGERVFAAENGYRRVAHFVEGEFHGPLTTTYPSGERRIAEYHAGEPSGRWSILDPDDSERLVVRWVDGKVASAVVASNLPRTAPPPTGFSPVDGAFGIEFGGDLNQFSGMDCQAPRYTFHGYPSDVGTTARCLDWMVDALWSDDHYYDVRWFPFDAPPRIVAGADKYAVEIDLDRGIHTLVAFFEFRSADECREEAGRVRDLLRGKYYAECPNFGVGATGQCDDRGILVREVVVNRLGCKDPRTGNGERERAIPYYELEYRTYPKGFVEETAERLREHGRPAADDL